MLVRVLFVLATLFLGANAYGSREVGTYRRGNVVSSWCGYDGQTRSGMFGNGNNPMSGGILMSFNNGAHMVMMTTTFLPVLIFTTALAVGFLRYVV